MAWNNNHIKAIKKYLIRYFAFCYNSAYKVHEDVKYGIGQQLQELELSHAKATQELDNKQDRIHYRIDMYGNTISPELVMYSIEEVDKDVSNKEIS